MIVRRLCFIVVVLLALSILACQGGTKTGVVGKWEATVTHKPSGTVTKMLWQFLPDGTFTAAPLADPTAIVDKDKYQIIDEGQTVRFRSQIIDNVSCPIHGDTMTAETPEYLINFRRL